jgi:hypothetical protein
MIKICLRHGDRWKNREGLAVVQQYFLISPSPRSPFIKQVTSILKRYLLQCYFHKEDDIYQLTTCNRFFLEKPIVAQLVTIFRSFLQNPEVHYRVHNSTPQNPIQGQMTPVHLPKPHFFNVHFIFIIIIIIIIVTFTTTFPAWSLALRFPN